MHQGARIDAGRLRLGLALQVLKDGDEGHQRVRHFDHGSAGGRRLARHDRGARLALPKRGEIGGVFDEGDIAGLSFLQRPGGVNEDVAVADQGAVNQGRQLSHGEAHEMVLSSMKVALPGAGAD